MSIYSVGSFSPFFGNEKYDPTKNRSDAQKLTKSGDLHAANSRLAKTREDAIMDEEFADRCQEVAEKCGIQEIDNWVKQQKSQ